MTVSDHQIRSAQRNNFFMNQPFSNKSNKMKKFHDLTPTLSPYALKAIESFGFRYPTPVQATSIPLFLQNKDVCVEAMTGSGKTLAFAIPIFEMIRKQDRVCGKHDVAAIVISPTRELAVQIHDVISKIAQHYTSPAYTCALLVGGTSIQQDAENFVSNGGHIIIGTPGRILDVYNRLQSTIVIRHLEVLILDEADKLLDMGFKDTINRILSVLPKQRRTGLFSATQTKEVKELARAGLRNPVIVSVNVQNAQSNNKAGAQDGQNTSGQHQRQHIPSTLTNWYMLREYDERPYELVQFILTHVDKKIIVFCATCACVDYYSAVFHEITQQHSTILPKNLAVLGFHGKMVSKKRSSMYSKFKNLPSHAIMFTTDVAARGIDIPDVDWIVQLTAPKDPAFFVHRIGRTARAGKKGQALLFLTKEEASYVDLLYGRGVPLSDADDSNVAGSTSVIVHRSLEIPSSLVQEQFNFVRSKLTYDKPCYSILAVMKSLSKQDRQLLELSSAAFVAFIRAYTEHLCGYIFQLKELDIGAVGRAYALLRLPKMAETRGVRGKPIMFDTDPLNTAEIAYRNKLREEARLKRIDKALQELQDGEDFDDGGGEESGLDDADSNVGVDATTTGGGGGGLNSDASSSHDDDSDSSDADSEAATIPVSSKPKTTAQPVSSNMSVRTLKTFATSKTNKSGMLKKAWIPSEKYKEIVAEKSKSKTFDSRYLRTTVEDVILEKRKRKKKTSYVKKMEAEWDDLADEEMLYRKFKKGKISKAEYDEKLLSGKKAGEDEDGLGGKGGGDSSGFESEEDDMPSRKKMKKMMQQQQQSVGKGKKTDYRKKVKKF